MFSFSFYESDCIISLIEEGPRMFFIIARHSGTFVFARNILHVI